MYPASRESAAFGDQAMMRFALAVPNNFVRSSEQTGFPNRVYSKPINRCVISSLRSKLRKSSLSDVSPAIDLLGLDEDLPCDPSDLVRQRNDDLIAMHALF